jgi:AraC-like DNA-binding protein
MDVEERSRWIIATPSAAAAAQPYFASEVGDFYARNRFMTARSDKNSFIVFYTLGGAGVVRQGGQEVTLTKGQALLMDCRSPQSYGTAPGHGHWYHLWTHVDGGGVSMAGAALGLPKLVPVSVPLSRLQPHFNVLFDLLEHESLENQARTSLAVHGIMCELLVAAQQATPTSDEDPVALVCAHIDEHYAERLSVDDLAAVAAVSPSYLIRLFKRQMGTTPHDYLLRRRITRAKELLAETTLTSAAIALQVGFTSESNFSYRFKQMVGQGPRAYRLGAPELVLS